MLKFYYPLSINLFILFVSSSITNTTATILSLIHYKICIHTTGNSLEDFVITTKLVDTLKKANVDYPLVSKDTIQEELHG